MNNFKLSIELVPKGAWGNNLRTALPKKDWDTLREICYQRANGACDICGYKTDDLDAHEVWEYDINAKTQTLKDIVALCSRCQGVKHFRNSERLGYGDNAKRHFLKVNNCDEMTLANHIFESQMLFEKRNEIFRWKIVANLEKFCGTGMVLEERNIPMIKSPYENIDFKVLNIKEQNDFLVIKLNPQAYFLPPKILLIAINNYQGIITIVCNDTNKIEWFLHDELIKTKYNIVGKFITTFKIEKLEGKNLKFKLTGDGGQTFSKVFALLPQEVL